MRVILTRSLCFLAAAIFLLSAGQAQQAKPWIGRIAKGYYSGHTDRAFYVIRDQAEFEALWATVYSTIVPAPPAPEIDFDYVMIVAAFQGLKPSGGYEIAFQKRTIVGDIMQVRIFEYLPPPGCGVSAALTQPYDIVTIPKSDLRIKFKVKQKVAECE
jgi:hypothetical protein